MLILVYFVLWWPIIPKVTLSCFVKVKETVEESLKKHELTRTLATKEFVWFAVCIHVLSFFKHQNSIICFAIYSPFSIYKLLNYYNLYGVGLCFVGSARHHSIQNPFSPFLVSFLYFLEYLTSFPSTWDIVSFHLERN